MVNKVLTTHFTRLKDKRISALYDQADRAEKFHLNMDACEFDITRHHIDADALSALVEEAEGKNLSQAIDALFDGESMNFTEQRSVGHHAMRGVDGESFYVNGKDMMPDVLALREKITDFVDDIHRGIYTGHTGKKITDIVHIGIGGSHLGPKMVVEALSAYHQPQINCHFLANIDPAEAGLLFPKLDPETTLFIVVSKSFTTLETMENARAVKDWLIAKNWTGEAIAKHFVAATINEKAAIEFGVGQDNIFLFWEWVGGRFSLWSSAGLVIPLMIGSKNHQRLLDGAHQADQHFKTINHEQNIPVLMGLLGHWYRRYFHYPALAIMPYSSLMAGFSDYSQQIDMESNGKQIGRDNEILSEPTGPIVFGQPGTNAQHAFCQWLHQGTDIIPTDIIVFKDSDFSVRNHQEWLVANAYAQADALMMGDMKEDKHRSFLGNRPSTVWAFDKLTPESLGFIMACYEHKIFVQGILWDINSFDQFGVELGKRLALEHFEQNRKDA